MLAADAKFATMTQTPMNPAPQKTVKRGALKPHPLPKLRSLIRTEQEFNAEEMARIKRGFIPEAMEDKWFIYFSRNRLRFHRSWTGFCVYVAHFKPRQDNFVLSLIEANRDAEQYTGKEMPATNKWFFT